MIDCEPKSVLLLEPCAWRYEGIARFLRENGFGVDGGPDLPPAPAWDDPDAVMVAHTLVSRYGRDLFTRIRSAYPLIGLLVHGETECLDETASILALGAQGYFVLSSPQRQLLDALHVIAGGGMWAPRAAVARMVQQRQSVAEDHGEDRMLFTLLLEGLSNKEIASRRGIAEVTVKAHLTRLYKRHGVRTRLQLLSAAIRQHLIDLAP